MEKIEKKHRKRIKISDEELFDYVNSDRREAESFFASYVAKSIKSRYDLIHSNDEYYNEKFPSLSRKSRFSSSDIKDCIESIMPSLTEVYFGAEELVGIFGRSKSDNPEVLKNVIQYQLRVQNDMYKVFEQWIRDSLETGLGVVRLYWDRREERQRNWYRMNRNEFVSIPLSFSDSVLDVIDNEDGSYDVKREEYVVTRNQPMIENVKPGEYIWIDKNYDSQGTLLYSAFRRYVPLDYIYRMKKEHKFKNVEKDFPIVDINGGDSSTIDALNEARANYSKQTSTNNFETFRFNLEQEGRTMVLLYDHYGYYDVDNDGILEYVHATTCNGVLLFAEVMEDNTEPFFKINFFSNSYQVWKESVADFLQEIQDVRTALVRQILVNTAQNNNRQFGVNIAQERAIEDIESGRPVIRLDYTEGGVNDVLKPMPQYPLDPNTFNLLEYTSVLSEQKTGITKYNQGLDADSLNKTATGISKIMAASQQRLRKMTRDGAESGIVPLYKYLVMLDKRYLDEEFSFRITEKYLDFKPDDINGQYDVQIVSNIGLQDKDATAQNLIFLFQNIMPALMQIQGAKPDGLVAIAKQIIRAMGFTNPETFLYGDGETNLPSLEEQEQQRQQQAMQNEMEMQNAQTQMQADANSQSQIQAAQIRGAEQELQAALQQEAMQGGAMQ